MAVKVKKLPLVGLCPGGERMEDISDRHENTGDESAEDDPVRARREFLKKCGKYAVVVPPTMALLLARTRDAKAVAY